MDARKFFFVSAGILCLVAAHQLGATRARADWNGTGFVVGIGDGNMAWNALGEAYYTGSGDMWGRQADCDLPVPASDVRLIDGSPSTTGMLLVTTRGDVWWHGGGGAWRLMPPLPGGGPVPVDDRSFGATKAKYH